MCRCRSYGSRGNRFFPLCQPQSRPCRWSLNIQQQRHVMPYCGIPARAAVAQRVEPQDRSGGRIHRDSSHSAVTTNLTIGQMTVEERNKLLHKLMNSTSVPRGVTMKELAALGIPMPLRKGWRKRFFSSYEKASRKPWLRTIPSAPQPTPPPIVERTVSAWSRKASLFYRSREWADARYDALKRSKGNCELCGRGKLDGVVLNVDHIKPIRYHWELRLVLTNLQVLCGMCNRGKGNRDETDWREKEVEMTGRWRDLVKD